MLIHNADITGSLLVNGTGYNTGSFSGSFIGAVAGTTATASYVEYNSVANKPALVSGSSQITYSGLSGIPSGIVSGSSQVTYSGLTGIPSGIVSGSAQVSFNGIVDKPTLISGSSQVTYSDLTGIPSGIVSGSAQVAGFGIFATTGSNQFNGSQAITGSLTVTGQVVAQTLNVQQVTSSIVYSSGSNIFGNSVSNTQQFTGSMGVTGSLTVTTSGVELQVTNTGVNLGNALTDSHIISGSVTINPSGLFVSGSGNVGIGTTSPAQKLQINGPLALGNLAEDFTTNQEYAYPIVYASNLSGLGNGELVIQPRTTATRSIRFVTRTSGAVSSTNPDTRMIIRWDGNVGIGTSSPGYKLDITALGYGIQHYGDSTNSLRTYAGSGYQIIEATTSTGVSQFGYLSGNFFIEAGGSERIRITSGGNVGIGTTSPAEKLTVYTGTNYAAAFNTTSIESTTTRISLGALTTSGGGTGGSAAIGCEHYHASTTASALTFYTYGSSFAERMRITSGGNVGIGTTSPINIGSGYIGLSVAGDNTSGRGGYLSLMRSTTETFRIISNSTQTEMFTMENTPLVIGTNSTERLRITSGGNVGIGNTSPSAKLNTNLSVEGDLLAYLVNTSATFNAGANIAVTHNSSTLGTNTAAGILLANNNNSNNAISPLIAFSAKSESTSYNHTYAAIYGQKRASGADANWNTGDLIIATGNATGPVERLRILAAGGLTFNGDTAAANALDDYEEGTWTPVLIGGGGEATYSNRYGWYTKIGRQVTVTWFINFQKNTITSTMGMSNLPFTALSSNGAFYPQGPVLLDNLSTTTNNITFQVANGTTQGDFIGGNGGTSSHTGLPASVLGSGTMVCRGTATYFV